MGRRKSIHTEPWPIYDEIIASRSPVNITVQVNGKTRGSFAAARGESKEELRARAIALPAIGKWIEGKTIPTVVVVPDRLVNIVARDE